jgi:hypothetical protein
MSGCAGVGRAASLAGLVVLALVSPSAAVLVGGGGSSATDCLAVFDAPANYPATRPKQVRCADGDPCDADGTVNGRCEFAVALCINSEFDPRCTLRGVEVITVDHALDNGDRKFDPEFQALQTRIDSAFELPTEDPGCTLPTTLRVPVLGPFAGSVCRKSRKTVKVVTLTPRIGGRVYKDRDRLRLTCEPAPAGCDPRAFFTGTFDRIQKQVFNQSCALSGCHDSQSQAGGMRLEDPAYGSLVDDMGVGVTPANQAATDAGWKRVMPGDPTTSFLFRKITGDLPSDAFGEPMPLIGPDVDPHLVDIIRAWIKAGAPREGWVAGTDG